MTKPKRRRSLRKLTLKMLGHVDDGRHWLCGSYANTRDNFKVVEDVIIGYYIAGDGQRAPVRIAPIYKAAIWVRVSGVISSYEIGNYYNPYSGSFDGLGRPIGEDHTANAAAAAARLAIIAVESAAEVRGAKMKRTRRK